MQCRLNVELNSVIFSLEDCFLVRYWGQSLRLRFRAVGTSVQSVKRRYRPVKVAKESAALGVGWLDFVCL